MKKKNKNLYVIRKVVQANSIKDALLKEKNAAIVDIILVSSEPVKQLNHTIGFQPGNTYDENGTI